MCVPQPEGAPVRSRLERGILPPTNLMKRRRAIVTPLGEDA